METHNLNALVVDIARTEFVTIERASGPLPFLQAAHTQSCTRKHWNGETTWCKIFAFLQLVETSNLAISLELLPYSNVLEQHRCVGLPNLAHAQARCYQCPTPTYAKQTAARSDLPSLPIPFPPPPSLSLPFPTARPACTLVADVPLLPLYSPT